MSKGSDLISRGEKLFGNRGTLMQLWQDIAEQFYVERADFTATRTIGNTFAEHLQTSYPMMIRRELADQFSAMLRPTNLQWFHTSVVDEDSLSTESRIWLERATKIQRNMMYDRRSQFNRATKEADNDFAAFGQAVISREINWAAKQPHLMYRSWHLRDVAWAENKSTTIGEVHRRWKPEIRELLSDYRGNVHGSVARAERDKGQEIPCRHIVMDSERYDSKFSKTHPWVCLVVDCDNDHIMAEYGRHNMGYNIPRWQTVSGSQYAYSPATVAGLPDARLLQAITLTLLEAGEMAVRPPLIAVQDAIKEGTNYYSGGVTIADADYDERLGDVLRPITQDKSGLPFGIEMAQDQREMLASAFYLNKLTLPEGNKEMTATETMERIEEYVRGALPLFEPMEIEYNGGLCEDTYQDLMQAGVFGSFKNVPEELRHRDVHFKFESPLHDALERKKGIHLQEGIELTGAALQIDPTCLPTINARVALRDALHGIQMPARWMNSERAVEEAAMQQIEMESERQAAAGVVNQSEAAVAAAEGAQAVQQLADA